MPTILILDHKQIYLELFAVFFQKHGFETVVATNASEALGRMRESPVDLILMEVELPGVGGLHFLHGLRDVQAFANLPAIILTDVHDRNTVIRAAALGVRDYVLRNCFSGERLIARIHQLLEASRDHAAASVAGVAVDKPAKTRGEPTVPGTDATALQHVLSDRAHPTVSTKIVSAENHPAGEMPPDVSNWPRLLAREQTIARLDRIINGKTMAGVVAHVIAVASSPDADLGDVVRVIQSDPLLASRVLQVANSAAFGSRTRVHGVDDAARAIGVRAILNIAIGVGIFGAFPPDELDGFNTMRCWQHSFAVAELMGSIIRVHNPEQEGFNHLLGLCHDLGEILLRQHFMAEHERIVAFAQQHELPVNQVESVALGVRHPELVSRLLHCMGLPSKIVDFTREFHERQSREMIAGMSAGAQLLNFANFAAHGLLLAASPQELVRPITRMEWRTLVSDRPPPAIDPVMKRNEILCATNALARLPAHEEKRLIRPAIVRTSCRVHYVRPEAFVELDPLAFALQLTRDLRITSTLPNATQLHDVDGMVLVGLRVGTSPVVPAELAHICRAAGCPDLPILALVGQDVPASKIGSLTIRRYPIRLAEIEQWQAAIIARRPQKPEFASL